MTLDFDARRDVLMAFATPVAQIRLREADALNPALRTLILDKAAHEKGRQRSNVGGWHSRDDFLDWPHPAVRTLKESFEQAVRHMMGVLAQAKPFALEQTLQAWANVCRAGDYHAMHTHPSFHWSGVYYVAAGSPAEGRPRSGVLELVDPRGGVDMAGMPGNPFGRSIAVPARDGLIVIFPSWLNHWVNPYFGAGERISVAFNARVTSFRIETGEQAVDQRL